MQMLVVGSRTVPITNAKVQVRILVGVAALEPRSNPISPEFAVGGLPGLHPLGSRPATWWSERKDGCVDHGRADDAGVTGTGRFCRSGCYLHLVDAHASRSGTARPE